MKKKSRIGTVFSSVFRVRQWLDWDRLKYSSLYLGRGVKQFVEPDREIKEESFKEAVARLNLTDTDLIEKEKALYRLALIMVCAATFIFFYLGYLLFYGSYRSIMVCFMVMLIALILAFRYHFWYYQIKNRKLGCTLKEWYQLGLMGGKK